MSLLGVWEADENDHATITDLGKVRLNFRADGQLSYAIHAGDRWQVMNLHYHTEGSTLITDQPSAPRIEHTAFSLSNDGVLTLAFDGKPYKFKRLE